MIKDFLSAREVINDVANAGRSIAANVARACDKSSRITGVRSVGTSSWIDTDSYETTQQLY